MITIDHLTKRARNPAAGGGGMNETCDRCGPAARAAYRASRGGQLYLCGHCANQLRPALCAQGWAILRKYAEEAAV